MRNGLVFSEQCASACLRQSASQSFLFGISEIRFAIAAIKTETSARSASRAVLQTRSPGHRDS
jgi:hypothetical protein